MLFLVSMKWMDDGVVELGWYFVHAYLVLFYALLWLGCFGSVQL